MTRKKAQSVINERVVHGQDAYPVVAQVGKERREQALVLSGSDLACPTQPSGDRSELQHCEVRSNQFVVGPPTVEQFTHYL